MRVSPRVEVGDLLLLERGTLYALAMHVLDWRMFLHRDESLSFNTQFGLVNLFVTFLLDSPKLVLHGWWWHLLES